jgi:hypothetical protein
MEFLHIHHRVAADHRNETIAKAERANANDDRGRGRRSFIRFSGPRHRPTPRPIRRFA